ncbi:MAG: FkbM family methyltransferase [Bryobacteraceae bacterium]
MTRSVKEAIRRMLPRTVRVHRILAGPLRGAWLCTSWHDYPGALLGTTERPLLDWFARHVKPGETWLDVGAHYGYTSLALSRLTGAEGRVFAFEPVAETVACLERTRAVNGLGQLRIVPVALSDAAGRGALRLPQTRGMADRTVSELDAERHETIAHQSLDTLWPEIAEGRGEVAGIKIDVQGMELEVLGGMQDLLRVQRPRLVVEFHAGVDRGLILELLSQCGYSTFVQAIDGGSSAVLQDDCSYVFSG